VRADQFYIAPPSGADKGVLPFAVQTTPTTINGVSVPAGTYLDNAFIKNGSIDSAKIANAAITNAKIGVGEITSAKIGQGEIKTANIDDLSVTTAKIGTAQVDTLQIAGEAVIVPRAQYNPNDVMVKGNGNQVKLLTTSLETIGNVVSISLGFEGIYGSFLNYIQDSLTFNIGLYRNGTQLKSYNLPFGKLPIDNNYAEFYINSFLLTIPVFLDTPPSGINVYEVYVRWGGNNTSKDNFVVVQGCSIQLLGIKR
jgi:hypothetical protein